MASDSAEQYLLLLLSDSNLPTGGFIASSGLESYIQHGYLSLDSNDGPRLDQLEGTLHFVQKNLTAFADINMPFVNSVYTLMGNTARPPAERIADIAALDREYDAMVLNHVARRASSAQGVAMLSLYERAFAPSVPDELSTMANDLRQRVKHRAGFLGHYPVSFAVVAAALALSLEATQRLLLFLQARSVLSSAIRMNAVGPYASHRVLLHDIRPVVEETLARTRNRTVHSETENDEIPCMTWPLGEILNARHDLLHSRIFNS